MTTEGHTSTDQRDTSSDLLREPPRPRPLLMPAIGLALGIWLSESIGPVEAPWRTVALAAPPAAFALLLVLYRRSRATGANPNPKRERPVLAKHGSGSHSPARVPGAGLWCVLLVTLLALGVGFTRHQIALDRPSHSIVHALSDEPVLTRLAGRIVTTPVERPAIKRNPFLPFDPPPRTQFVLDAQELCTTDPPTATGGHVRVSVEAVNLGLRLGQRVQITGKLYRPAGPRNPGARDWARWYHRQGIDAGMLVEGPAHVRPLPGPGSWWHRLIATARGTAQSLLFEPYADVDADQSVRLLDVMVLGQRSAATQDLNEAFRRAGGMHFLAVSGFHVGVLAGAAWWLVRHGLRRSRRIAAIVMLLAAVVYALVAEPNAPILRATTMVAIVALAIMAARPACLLNWLALAAGGILLGNPHELFRAGFQFSFVQTIGLIVLVPTVHRRLFDQRLTNGPPVDAQNAWQLVRLKTTRWLGTLAVICVCAWAVSVPLKLSYFGYIAPWGWLATFLLSPLIVFTITLSFATLLANALLPPLGVPLAFLLHECTDVLLWIVGLFEHVPGSLVACRHAPGWFAIVSYLAVLALVLRTTAKLSGAEPEAQRRTQRPIVSGVTLIRWNVLALLVLAWLGWLFLPPSQRGVGYAIHVLSVGNGSTVLLTAPGGRAIVYDVGTITNSDAGETAAMALRALGIRRLAAVLSSHANFDHYSGLPTLMEHMRVQRWLTNSYFIERGRREGPVDRLLAELPTAAPPPETLRAGDRLALGDATLEILWPPAGLDESWSANDRSLVLRFTVAGRSVLLTGDTERAALAALVEAAHSGRIDLRADVLLAPHHGAVKKDVTAAFYAAVAPRTVVVSSRARRPKLEQLLARRLPATRILTTGTVGAVVLRITPAGELRIETPYAP